MVANCLKQTWDNMNFKIRISLRTQVQEMQLGFTEAWSQLTENQKVSLTCLKAGVLVLVSQRSMAFAFASLLACCFLSSLPSIQLLLISYAVGSRWLPHNAHFSLSLISET